MLKMMFASQSELLANITQQSCYWDQLTHLDLKNKSCSYSCLQDQGLEAISRKLIPKCQGHVWDMTRVEKQHACEVTCKFEACI